VESGRGFPDAVRTDQGPEFTSRAFMAWAHSRRVRHLLNDAGSPTQNAYIESFNGKFRDECLNEQWFETLAQARQEISRWRRDYNEVRPHSAIGRIPPAQFAAAHRQLAGDAQHPNRRSSNLQTLGLCYQSLARLKGAGRTSLRGPSLLAALRTST
jgi:putative transposase